jgi:hypothetical protein
MRTSSTKNSLIIGISIVLGASLLSVGVSNAAGTTIKACAKKSNGAMRLIDASKKCTKSERTLTWGTQGDAGTTGATGPAGTAGATGAAGTNGATGASGISYATFADLVNTNDDVSMSINYAIEDLPVPYDKIDVQCYVTGDDPLEEVRINDFYMSATKVDTLVRQ